MTNSPRLTFPVRLEDMVAIVFFLLNLLLRIVFHGLGGQSFNPADVLIIIPAVTLLLAKEMVHYFLAGKSSPAAGGQGPGDFIRPFWEILRDWFPFLVILMMYYSLWGNATLLIFTSDRDQALMALDQRLFGFQASVVLQRIVSPALTSWMVFAYFSHVLIIPVVACFIYIWRGRVRCREMMSGLMVVCFFGLLGYLLVPAIGPVYAMRNQFTVPLHNTLFNQEFDFMDYARIQRDVFPSMHVAISFVAWLYAYRNSKALFWILSPLILSLWLSTLYLRYHYLIDVVAGLILAPLCFLLANWLFQRWGEIPVSIAIPRSWAERLPWLAAPSHTDAPPKAQERL